MEDNITKAIKESADDGLLWVNTSKGSVSLQVGHYYYIEFGTIYRHCKLVFIDSNISYSSIDTVFGDTSSSFVNNLRVDHPISITEVSQDYWDRARKARDMYLAAIHAIDQQISETIYKQGNEKRTP